MAWDFEVLCDWIHRFPLIDSSFLFPGHHKIVFWTNLNLRIVALALLQAIVQLLFFLHVGQEAKPRWETLVFCLW